MKKATKQLLSNKKTNSALAEAIVEVEETTTATKFPNNVRKSLLNLIKNRKSYVGGTALIASTFVANVLNYIFNAYLGRVLSFDNFALIGLISSFFSFALIPFSAYGTTVTYKGSFLMGKYDNGAGYHYWRYMIKHVRFLAIASALLWLCLTPFLMNFFHTDNAYLFIFFAAVLLFGFFNNINFGFLSAKMMFGSLAILSLADPVVKLLTGVVLTALEQPIWTFAAIPLASLSTFVVAWILVFTKVNNEQTKAPISETHHFSKRFFIIALLTTFSSLAYFTFDIFLAKHFLSPTDAGRYTLVSVVGKMIFFLGNLTAPFIIPLLSRSEGAQKDSLKTLYYLVAFTSFFAFIGFVLFGLLSFFTVPLLFGAKALSIVRYLPYYTFGMMCYTISSVLINFYLVRKVYTFTIATTLLILLQIGLITLFHDSVQAITFVMTGLLITHLLVTVSLHFVSKSVKAYEIKLGTYLRKPYAQSK